MANNKNKRRRLSREEARPAFTQDLPSLGYGLAQYFQPNGANPVPLPGQPLNLVQPYQPGSQSRNSKIISSAIGAVGAAAAIKDASNGKLGDVAKTVGKAVVSSLGDKVKSKRNNAVATTVAPPTTLNPPKTNTKTTTTTTTSSSTSRKINNGKIGSYLMVCDKPTSDKINLSTGIRSGLIVNSGEPMSRDDFSPLYTMGVNILKKDNIATSFKEYIETNVFPTVQTAVQFSLNYAYELKLEDFNSWFYTLTSCLQLVYTLDTVIAYCDLPENTNQGLRFLRTKITSPIRLKLNLLRDLLGKQPIPRNVLQYVRYLTQNYKFSTLPGAPVYRLVPGNLFNKSATAGPDVYYNALDESMLTELINKLTSLSPVYNKIYQAMPFWHVPNNCLPPVSNTPYYDEGFRTMWFNSCCTYSKNNETIFTRSSDTGFRYWLYTNEFDGIFFASTSFNKSTSGVQAGGTQPGLLDPTDIFTGVVSAAERSNAQAYFTLPSGYGADGMYTVRPKDVNSSCKLGLQFDNIATPYYTNAATVDFSIMYNQDGSTQVAQECTFETWKQAVFLVTQWLFM